MPRPVKYQTEKERKEARKEAQARYRKKKALEGERVEEEYTLMLDSSALTALFPKGTRSKNVSEVLKILYEFKQGHQLNQEMGKEYQKSKAELRKIMAQKLQDLILNL